MNEGAILKTSETNEVPDVLSCVTVQYVRCHSWKKNSTQVALARTCFIVVFFFVCFCLRAPQRVDSLSLQHQQCLLRFPS